VQRVDVAIAGAGIGGAVLALLLARRGLTVTLVEGAARFAPIYRGEFLQPRSLEILAELGLSAAIEAVTTSVDAVHLRTEEGKRLAEVDYRILKTQTREGRNGHHRQIQRVILDALAMEQKVSVQMGTRVTGVLHGDQGEAAGLQTAHGSVPAWLTVGADGQYSVVRTALGLPVRTFRYSGEPLAVTVDTQEQLREVQFLFGRGMSALAFPLPDQQARLYLVLPDLAYAELREEPDRGLLTMKNHLARLLPEFKVGIAAIPSMERVQRVPCWYLRADRWVSHGAALIGDAVHCVSPTRGQGMNLAIQDAWALAELVASLPRDRFPSSQALQRYERVRRPLVAFIQRDAGRVHRFLLANHPAVLRLRDLWLSSITRAPKTTAAVLGMYAGTARAPVWFDHLFVSLAVAVPALDSWVSAVWGSRLQRPPSPVE
jgi:2-polyprenyl-6-methoxyphenol hydroxylase-like FAD-dependent oxidoreductase